MNGIHVARLDKMRKVRGIIHPSYGDASDIITFDPLAQPKLKCEFMLEVCGGRVRDAGSPIHLLSEYR